MSETLPDPLVPIEVDLREFAFMPLDVRRLRDSRLVATRSGDECLAAILLWSASWHQQPAASLPNDDIELSQLAGYGRAIKEFRRIREGALHGLILCSDGRLYHPVVAEKAAEAWNGRLEMEWRRAADRVRKENKERAERKEESAAIPPRPALLSVKLLNGIPTWRYVYSAGIPSERLRNSSLKGEGQGKGRGTGDSGQGTVERESIAGEVSPVPPQLPSAAASAAPARKTRSGNGKAKPEAPTAKTWAAYATAYEQRYHAEPVRNAKVNGMLARFCERIPLEEAPQVAAFFVHSNRGLYVSAKHAVDLLLRDAEGLRTEWATGSHGTETQARQADQTAATGNVFGKLIAEAEDAERLAAKE